MLFSYIKKPTVYISVIVIAAGIAGYFAVGSSKGVAGEVVTATTGAISDEVFITGTVEAAHKVSLSFDRAGSVRALPYPVGATVQAGSVIASLKNETEQASVAESKASVAIEEANLAKILQGTREEELRLKESEKRQAEVSLQNSTSKTLSILTDVYSASEEAVNRYADPFFSNDDTEVPRLTYRSGTQEAYDAERDRLKAGTSVKNIQKAVQKGDDSIPVLEQAVTDARVAQNLFVTLGLTLRDGSSLDATTLADYRSRVTSARSALTTAISSAQDQVNSLRNAAAELDRVSHTLELARAKATPETVRGAEQTVLQARAKLRSAEASLEKTFIRAPFSGQISSKHTEIGETVSSGSPVMEFLGTSAYTIEANVPEADITKIAQGDSAEVTLDAYGDNFTFPARVIEIEPASTEIEGVSTYKTTFSIENVTKGIRSGMTANITVKKLLKENALVIPVRAVSTEGGVSFVLLSLPDGTTRKTEVSLGSRNNAREIEVLKGVREGDTVVIPAAK